MESYQELTVGEIVKNDFRKAEVFKKYDIDFCCKGKLPLTAACENKHVDVGEIENALVDVDNSDGETINNFATWDADQLVDYILEKHHAYVADAIPHLHEYTEKVARVHGERKPDVEDIYYHFQEMARELQQHMHKEEMILFPFIKALAQAKKSDISLDPPMFGTIENPIRMMEMEHENAGEIMAEIRKLTENYTPPAGACMTHQVSYHKLKEFENDLHEHIHLENNILFPKALELEKELIK